MDSDEALLIASLGELAGAVWILDAERRVRVSTPEADALLGLKPPLGASAAKLLCGHRDERPVAEAMALGQPVSAVVERAGGARVRVQASPLGSKGAAIGWVLALSDEPLANHEQGSILTVDPRMRELLGEVSRVAQSGASVLVRGESGTGKELIARAVHDASERAHGPFRAINCAALSPNLLESELFGHVKGAFTGAHRDAPGHFRAADGGTLFLDEVGELPLDVQAKLLRVLQERQVQPVGGTHAQPVDVRIVAATHRALRKEVAAGRFRADLLYRLRVVPLFLPALRERRADIPLLANHFLSEHSNVADGVRFRPAALSALEQYSWPGNVRELQNAIEYAVVMADGRSIGLADLPPEIRGDEVNKTPSMRPSPTSESPTESHTASYPASVQRILNALERSGGHVGRAAASLGMSRTTLWRKLKKHGVSRDV